MAVRDLSQARDGVSTGREFAPRARKIVFPVWEESVCWVILMLTLIID